MRDTTKIRAWAKTAVDALTQADLDTIYDRSEGNHARYMLWITTKAGDIDPDAASLALIEELQYRRHAQ